MGTPIQDFLDEAGTSTIRVTRKKKMRQVAGKSAINMAKRRRDPLYAKYTKYRKLYLDAKNAIKRKYGRRGMQHARKALR